MPSLLDDPEAYAFAAQIAEDRRRKLTNQQALNAILQGVGDLPYTLLGAPVEISTGLLRAGGMAQGEQAGGIDYFKRKATELGIRPPDSDNPTMRDMRMGAEIAMGGVDPTRVARAGGAVAGAVAREAKPIIGDALENYMAKSGLAPRMTVFHGSPYKFNAFDPTKIGSGEGAQAYAYGHYSAQARPTAEQYQKTVSRDMFDVGGEVFNPSVLKHLNVRSLANKGDLDNAIAKAEQISKSDSPSANLALQDLTILNQVKEAGGLKPLAGNLYKIDLPDDQISKMLNWDEELGKQTTEIQKLAKQYGLGMDDLGGDLIVAMDAKRAAGAEAMRQAGIPGVKYLDEASRGSYKARTTYKGQPYGDLMDFRSKNTLDEYIQQKQAEGFDVEVMPGTSNFVVFPKNEGLLKIEEVNGQPVRGGLLNTDYRGSHKAPGPDFGAPLHDLTGGGDFYPADVYSAKATQYYGTGFPKADKEAFDLAKNVRGNPDAEVTMYRAVPKDAKSINVGDWVTLSEDYAKTHGESVLGKDYKIIEQKVKAKDLYTNADSIHEFGYYPDETVRGGLL